MRPTTCLEGVDPNVIRRAGKESVGLELDHVDKAKRHPILREVSLGIRPGEAVGLVGPNGVGKTTLFKVAVGLWQPDRGQVRWEGRADQAAARRRRAAIGVVGELAPLDPYLSARDHLEMKRRVNPGVDAARMGVLRSALGREAFWTVPTQKLSQGQRVALDTALLPDPPCCFSTRSPMAWTRTRCAGSERRWGT